ncbi:MAG: PEP-CTERM system histidine kinase PrsK [Desulfuromonadaceae bacterium]|nr:PEP-CTERM system histidine kinase PrsK [Desulfuromonadaceae bacterium]
MSISILTIAAIIILLPGAGYALYKERSRTSMFLFAVLTTTAMLELFDMLSIVSPVDAFFWKKCALITESLLPPFWILCSVTFARQAGPWKMGLGLKFFVAFTFLFPALAQKLPLNLFLYAPDFPAERLLFLGDVGFYFYIGIMACLVFALVNFEVTLTNASPDALAKIKYEIIGLATILTVQVFYYSQALLYRSINMNYLPLRSFMYLVAATLIAYSLAYRRGDAHIQVSRQVAFKSIVLLAVGVYLVMLGLLGEGMQHFGVSFPRTVTVSLAFLGGIGLLLLMLSERVRREVKVSLHKNFYQHKHDYRTQWIRFTEQLSTSRSGDELLRRILAAYCDIFGITGSALYLYEENRGGYCKLAEHEIKLPETILRADNTLISFMTEFTWVISINEEVPDIRPEDARFFSENLISFVVPIFDGKRLEGFITLGPPVNRNETYIYEDYDLMKTIARQASLAILHQRLSDQISHAREIEAIGNVATFVAHDLKNLVSSLSLIVENAVRYIHNEDFQKDMLTSLGNTVDKMQKLIGRLRNLGEQDQINQQKVNLLELADKTAQTLIGNNITVSGTPEIIRVDENEIQKVILNLLMNAIEASAPNEPVAIEVGRSEFPFIRVIDKGCGMSARFVRSDAFKPFRTTKKKGLGIGLYQCRQIVEAHGGRIQINSEEGHGSIFTVIFSNSAPSENEAA